jgi:hypothetical protein
MHATLHVLMTMFALTCSAALAAAHTTKHAVKRTEIRALARGVPGPLELVELWVQSTTVLSVSFDEPEHAGDSRIDRYLIEWSLSEDFHEAAQGLVLVSRAVPMTSFQYDIVNLPHGTSPDLWNSVECKHQDSFRSANIPFIPRHERASLCARHGAQCSRLGSAHSLDASPFRNCRR